MAVPGDDAVCPTCGQAYAIRVAHCANDGTRLVPRRAQVASASGRVLGGRYEVHDAIAEGVLGAVYRGRQLVIDREIAIKIIRPALARDPAGAERFLHAARLACQLAGSAIITTLDVGRSEDGLMFVVMEPVRGRSLTVDLAAGRPLSVRHSLEIAIQICDALRVAQEHGACHGDLKPSNVMTVDEAARVVKVGDFGLARALTPDPWSMAPKLAQYVAPELADGHIIDQRSDLYSLGCILHELLSGKPPFSDTSTRALLEKHLREPPPRLPREVPPALAQVVSRMLAKSPEERFESAAAVRAALHPMHPSMPASGVPLEALIDDVVVSRSRGRTGVHTFPGAPGTTGSHPHTARSGNHPHTGISGLRPHTGISETHPSPAAPPPPQPGPRAPAPSGARRIVVIGIVAVVASGLGVLAYLFATGQL